MTATNTAYVTPCGERYHSRTDLPCMQSAREVMTMTMDMLAAGVWAPCSHVSPDRGTAVFVGFARERTGQLGPGLPVTPRPYDMAHQNRIAPTGEVVESSQRGLFTGNRGCLHEGTRIVRNAQVARWLICSLQYQGRTVTQWEPKRITWLFFTDEAVALAAGHRPCKLCGPDAYRSFVDAWLVHRPETKVLADQLDAVLAQERRPIGGVRPTHPQPWTALPDGTFVMLEDVPAPVRGAQLHLWSAAGGYHAVVERPADGEARVLTPYSSYMALLAGYRPQLSNVLLDAGGTRTLGADRELFRVPDDFDSPLPAEHLAEFTGRG